MGERPTSAFGDPYYPPCQSPRIRVCGPGKTLRAPDGLRSRDLLLDREVRTTGLLYGRRYSVVVVRGAVPPTGFEPVLPP